MQSITAPYIELRNYWMLDPGVHYLNHGSFGATPKVVLDAQDEWRARTEAQPVHFMVKELPGLLREAAIDLAHFLGVQGEDIAFIENATAGVNAVLRSYPWQTGDELLLSAYAYPAVKNVARYAGARYGVVVREFSFAFPLSGPEEIVSSLQANLTERTRLVLIDHVSSPLAIVYPLDELMKVCRKRSVHVLVDGAHAPGMLPLDISTLGVDWYIGNCHKWLFAPKGCGFLFAAPQVREFLQPAVVSSRMEEGFPFCFDWVGTRDFSAWLAITAALRFYREMGGITIPGRLHQFIINMAQQIAAAWHVDFPAPMSMFGAMMTLPFPISNEATQELANSLHDRLWDQLRIEVPVFVLEGKLWLRISCQLYNTEQDFAMLAGVLKNHKISRFD